MKQNLSQIALISNMTSNLFNAEAQLRQQRYALISAFIRELGGEVHISTGHNTAGVMINGMWNEVHKIVLANDEDYEVFFVNEETGEAFDAEDIEMFDTRLFGNREEFECDELLYFLQGVALRVMNLGFMNENVEPNKENI